MSSLNAGHFPKFSIFTGPPGVGKSTIAELVASSLVCQGSEKPCHQCPVCKMADSGKYPGIKKFNMAKISQQGDVNEVLSQIFDFESFTEQTVFILEEVQELEMHKEQSPWLEELMHIPDDIYIIMCTTQPYKLRQELRDRASIFELSLPDEEECYGLIQRASMVFNFPLPSGDVCKSLIAINRNNPRLIVSSLELLSQGGEITKEQVEQYYSIIETSVYVELFQKLFDKQVDLFEFVCHVETIGKEHKLVSVLRGLKEFCMRALAEVSNGTVDYTISKTDRERLRELIDSMGHPRFIEFMMHLGNVRTEIVSTKDAAAYELTMLKQYGLGGGNLGSRKQSVKDAGTERDKALKAARTVVTETSTAAASIQEMSKDSFLTQSRLYQGVQMPKALKETEEC